MKTKYYVKIFEGLGNQMFEYAWARAMQKLYGGTIVLDPHSYKKKGQRSFSLQNLYLNENVVKECGIKETLFTYLLGAYKKIIDCIIKTKSLSSYNLKASLGIYEQLTEIYYDSWKKPLMPFNYIEGSWMSEVWFKPVSDELKKEMKVKTPITAKSQEMLHKIRSCNSVCVHIRLGDILQEPWRSTALICGNEYYNEAIRIIKSKVENPVFFLFTNTAKDFIYIKENFKFDVEMIPVNLGNPDYEDLCLMYSCKHQISSNSTYSWWAQYLNENPDKVVVAPCMTNKHNKWSLTNLIQDNWYLVGPEYLKLEGMTCTKAINSLSPKIAWERVVDAYEKQTSSSRKNNSNVY